MPSSPSSRIRAELQASGENLNTWGAPKLNEVVKRLEEAKDGRFAKTLTADYALVSSNYVADEARMGFLDFSGSPASPCTVTIPGVEKTYLLRNATAGDLKITTGSGTYLTLHTGTTAVVAVDGTNVRSISANADDLATTLAAAKAYTDAASLASGSLPLATGLSDYFLATGPTGGGSASVPGWVSPANALLKLSIFGVPRNGIMAWYGAVGSIPTGWALCDGTNGTPDLRGQFIVGAGGAYAVAATGGAASSTPTITVGSHALTIGEIPGHVHGVTDPGHAHTAADGGHAHVLNQAPHTHGISDPGHSHTIGGGTAVVTYGSGGAFHQAAPSFGDALTLHADATVTGVSVIANYADASIATGFAAISIGTSFTGISIQSAGSGAGHTHAASSSAVPTLPPYYALCYIMKT